MKKIIVFLFIFIVTTPLYSFNYKEYDLTLPVTVKIKPTLNDLENPAYIKNVIKQLNLEIKKNPYNYKLHQLRNMYSYLLWDSSPEPTKEIISRVGLEYALDTIRHFPNRPDGYLWKGIFLGIYGLSVGVLNVVGSAPQMKRALLKSYKMDKKYFYSHAAFVLGRMYFKLPSFPISFGDVNKAEKYIREALSLNDHYVLPYVFLAEVLVYKEKKKEAMDTLNKIPKVKSETWYQKVIKVWTVRELDSIKRHLFSPDWNRYKYDFMTDPARHPQNQE